MRHIVSDSTSYSPCCAYSSCSLKVTWEINGWMNKESLDIFLRVMAWSTLAHCVSETMEVTPSKRGSSEVSGRTSSWKSFPAETPQSTSESHTGSAGCTLYGPSPLLLLLQPICMHASLVCNLAGCRITDDWQPFPENIGSACSLAMHGCFTVTGLSAEASPGTAHVQNVCLRYCQTWQPGDGY